VMGRSDAVSRHPVFQRDDEDAMLRSAPREGEARKRWLVARKRGEGQTPRQEREVSRVYGLLLGTLVRT
jgi:hypothetical protein